MVGVKDETQRKLVSRHLSIQRECPGSASEQGRASGGTEGVGADRRSTGGRWGNRD